MNTSTKGKNNEVSSMQENFTPSANPMGTKFGWPLLHSPMFSDELMEAQELWETKFDSEAAKEIVEERNQVG